VPLRKGATHNGIAAELISLLETVTADGTITDSEAGELRVWLEQNRDSDLPAIDFLRTTLDHILADGKITAEERKALHIAVERVLPSELRQKAKGRRVANDLVERARVREEKAASRARAAEEREKRRCVYSANFLVAGVVYERRAKIVDRHLRAGQTVFLARDPSNPHDQNAVEIRIAGGQQIGFVPREYARWIAPLMDSNHKQAAYCTKILNGRKAPIPVVQANLYRADAPVVDAISTSGVPVRSASQTVLKSATSGCGFIIGLTAFSLLVVGALILFR
jgi:HIRAN domain